MAQADLAAQVRNSVARTRSEGTASVRYRIGGLWLKASLVQWLEDPGSGNSASMLHRLDAARAKARGSIRTLDGPAGQIDLDGDRSIYGVGDWWNLFVDGVSYVGAPGEWEQDDEEDAQLNREDALLSEQEPQWHLALLAGCFEAQDRGVIELGDDRWHHHRTGCDFAQAASATGRAVAPPPALFDERLDLARIPVDVWLDTDGRIRRAVFHRGKHRTILELSDFRATPRVVPPERAEILDEEDE